MSLDVNFEILWFIGLVKVYEEFFSQDSHGQPHIWSWQNHSSRCSAQWRYAAACFPWKSQGAAGEGATGKPWKAGSIWNCGSIYYRVIFVNGYIYIFRYMDISLNIYNNSLNPRVIYIYIYIHVFICFLWFSHISCAIFVNDVSLHRTEPNRREQMRTEHNDKLLTINND